MSGFPAAGAARSGWPARNGVDALIALIGNPSVEGPLRLTLLALFAIAGLALG